MKLSDYMTENHLSRADVAKALDVSVEVVRQWIAGERRPRDAAVIAKMLRLTDGHVTPNDFYIPEDWQEREGAAQ